MRISESSEPVILAERIEVGKLASIRNSGLAESVAPLSKRQLNEAGADLALGLTLGLMLPSAPQVSKPKRKSLDFTSAFYY